ncbi:MAG: hypothetical protein ACREJB_06360 [Planctomycetaceae bacterium]
MATKEQIESFSHFASSQIDNGGAQLSMDELYSLWRAKNPTTEEFADSVAAVEQAHAELEAGQAGRPARAALRETCERLGLHIDE